MSITRLNLPPSGQLKKKSTRLRQCECCRRVQGTKGNGSYRLRGVSSVEGPRPGGPAQPPDMVGSHECKCPGVNATSSMAFVTFGQDSPNPASPGNSWLLSHGRWIWTYWISDVNHWCLRAKKLKTILVEIKVSQQCRSIKWKRCSVCAELMSTGKTEARWGQCDNWGKAHIT